MTSSQKLRSLATRSLGALPGDQRRVDRADRDSGDPIRMEVRFGEGLVNASLIGAECAAALQQQRDAFERRTAVSPNAFAWRGGC